MTELASVFGQRNLREIPDPDPELERQSFIVADGFEVNLYAADPLIAKPIQMNFDAEGRLWIASSTIYPHIRPGQEADDKILVIEDANRDGTADKTTVFADGLLIPTGVIPGDGGVYVANSTELLHFVDTNGDGKADLRNTVLSGFGTEDTHHLLHTLRWGPDGCLYMNQSIYIHSHIETPSGVKRLNGGGIWRFRPETLELEVFCEGFVNSWGHHVDDWGQSFATDGAYREGINYVFPGAVFFSAPEAKRILTGLNPGSPKHCGLEIVSGRHMPDDWQGNMLTNDFRANRVCRFEVTEDDGSGYASRQEVELIKSTHVAFRPIDVKMGPDGAIYVADWYNPIIQHGEVDFRDPRRDQVHGRIWRVTAKGRPLVNRPELTEASISALLDALKLPEEWNRQHAKLLLKARHPADVQSALTLWIEQLDRRDPRYEHNRLEALWVHQATRIRNERLLHELAQSDDHRVRAAAIRVAGEWDAESIVSPAARDSHPRVRLEAVRALSRFPSLAAARTAMLALDQPMDDFLDFALWRAMRELAPHWLPEVQSGRLVFGGDVAKLIYALKAVDSPDVVAPLLTLMASGKVGADRAGEVLTIITSLGGASELGKVFELVVADDSELSPATQALLLEALAATSWQRKVVPSGDLGELQRLLEADDLQVRCAALRAAGLWRLQSQRERMSRLALDANANRQERDAAIDGLTSLGGSAAVTTLHDLSLAGDYADRLRGVRSLSVIAPQLAAQRAASVLAELPAGADPQSVVQVLLGRKNGPTELAVALEGQSIPEDVAKLVLRAAQSASQQSPELVAAIRKAGSLSDAGWKLTPRLQEELTTEVGTAGDAHRGEAIYRRQELQCMKCHAIGGAGGRVGPDLISVGASAQIDYLVEALLDPNKKLKEGFHSIVLATEDGRVLTGIPIRQSDTEIVIRDAEDQEITVAISAIEERQDGRSLMPDGGVNSLTRAELVDLVAFLSRVGKVGDFSIGNQRVVRCWEALTWTQEAHRRLNRTSFDVAATDDPALTWRPAYSRVAGDLPLESLPQLKPHAETPPTTFLRFEIDVNAAGEISLRFNAIDGVELWIDGKPTPLETDLLEVDLSKGMHHVTLAIDRDARSGSILIELGEPTGSTARAQLVGGK